MLRGLGGLSEQSRLLKATREISKKSDKRKWLGKILMEEYTKDGQKIKKGRKLYMQYRDISYL